VRGQFAEALNTTKKDLIPNTATRPDRKFCQPDRPQDLNTRLMEKFSAQADGNIRLVSSTAVAVEIPQNLQQ
jgi:hypothetical protein